MTYFPHFQPSRMEYELALRGLHLAGLCYPYDEKDRDKHASHLLAIDADLLWTQFLNINDTGTEIGYALISDDLNEDLTLLVGFAGTTPLSWKDWKTNIDRELVPYANGGGEEVAEGDLRNWYRVRNELVAELERLVNKYPISMIHVGAHSLGAAGAVLAVREILENPKTKGYCFKIRVDTFGGKRFANPAFWSTLWALVEKCACESVQFRFWTHPADPVPYVPIRCHPNLPALQIRQKRWGLDWLWRKTPLLHVLPHGLESYEQHLLARLAEHPHPPAH